MAASRSDPPAEVDDRRRYVESELRRAPRLRWRRGRSAVRPGDRRPVVSRVLHRLGDASAHAAAGLAAMVAVLGWITFGAIIGFPDWWETAMYVTTSAITLVMVFAIQHTQSRQQLATQRKLDELVRSLPAADNRLIAAESASDEELSALGQLNATDRRSVVPDQRATDEDGSAADAAPPRDHRPPKDLRTVLRVGLTGRVRRRSCRPGSWSCGSLSSASSGCDRSSPIRGAPSHLADLRGRPVHQPARQGVPRARVDLPRRHRWRGPLRRHGHFGRRPIQLSWYVLVLPAAAERLRPSSGPRDAPRWRSRRCCSSACWWTAGGGRRPRPSR